MAMDGRRAGAKGLDMTGGSCIFAVVDRGKADGLLHRAQQMGARQGTIFLGEGTMPSRLLDFLGISETRKEVLLMAVPEGVSDALYGMFRDEFRLHRRNRGIAFSVPLRQFDPENKAPSVFNRQTDTPFICLITVLERGLGTECMGKARAAGARGGTILHAHGAGVPQDFFFPLVVEPQKDMVLIVAPHEVAPAIRDAIYTGMRLERRGSGILFALPVLKTLGLYEERQAEKGAGR